MPCLTDQPTAWSANVPIGFLKSRADSLVLAVDALLQLHGSSMSRPKNVDDQVQDMSHRLDGDITHRVADRLERFRERGQVTPGSPDDLDEQVKDNGDRLAVCYPHAIQLGWHDSGH